MAIEEKHMSERGRDLGAEPVIPMTGCIIRLVNKAFVESTIPSIWENSILVPIPKIGGNSDPNNYRGISFMTTTFKIISIALGDRIHIAAERKKSFVSEQAGFGRLEECVSQAAFMIDMLRRRKLTG